MAAKNEQMVELVVNYTTYLIPVDAAHAVQKAMLQAKQKDSYYYGALTVEVLQRPNVTVSIAALNPDEFDVTTLSRDELNAWRAMIKEAEKANPSLTTADIMDPVQFTKVRGK